MGMTSIPHSRRREGTESERIRVRVLYKREVSLKDLSLTMHSVLPAR